MIEPTEVPGQNEEKKRENTLCTPEYIIVAFQKNENKDPKAFKWKVRSHVIKQDSDSMHRDFQQQHRELEENEPLFPNLTFKSEFLLSKVLNNIRVK